MTNFENFIISNEEVAYIIQYQKLKFNFTKVMTKEILCNNNMRPNKNYYDIADQDQIYLSSKETLCSNCLHHP